MTLVTLQFASKGRARRVKRWLPREAAGRLLTNLAAGKAVETLPMIAVAFPEGVWAR
jgi:hypothetical protein